jgi:tetratricopeptide (TPR) repeat protein
MKTWKASVAVVASFVLGAAVARVLAGGPSLTTASFEGKDAKEAAAAMLAVAEAQAGSGTWELIGLGRIHYLSGDKTKGQALFDRATSGKPGASEWRRIGKVYAEAREFDKAEAALQKAVTAKSEDTSLAELGAMLNLNGKRELAEETFKKSIAKDPGDVWNTITMAGSYVGVRPD